MKLILLFLIAFKSEASFVTREDLSKIRSDESGVTVYTSEAKCPGKCFNIKGIEAAAYRPVMKMVDDLEKPIYKEIKQKDAIECGNARRDCRAKIDNGTLRCKSDEYEIVDQFLDWPGLEGEGWFFACGKRLGYEQKQVEVLEEDPDLRADLEQRKSLKEAKKLERKAKADAVKAIRDKEPSQWTDSEIKEAVKFLLERIQLGSEE